jgi:rhamnosyltransferase
VTVAQLTQHRVYAVVVTYLPPAAFLSELFIALAPQLERIVVVDNTPFNDSCVEDLIDELSLTSVKLIGLGRNLGIAKALNVGIEEAMQSGATHVLLSDQDSVPHSDMVNGLLRALSELTESGQRIGATGPTFTDMHTGITFPFQAKIHGKFFYGHIPTSVEHPLVEAMTLITSGSLIPVNVFSDVGLMREDLFIDKVDIEWCHRARAAGYKLFGTNYATMFHRLGDAHLRVWYFGWRKESVYSASRIYYQIRNFIALSKVSYISPRWKIRNAWFTLGVIYGQVVFGHDRRRCFHMALRGVCDGIRGNMGPLQH